ncbi:Gfo/Idh/MocA family oxidoreductase [Pseudarthrobacter sp. NamE2]|uniref:Gfo/Idh/MocA family protein n=1 Tax=Pseudarthrobacter sp. NamE2 TaxID=2576838 RepID=UPI0010FD1D17|nr:Gfo/Idh/MocA family oxidoreductase [Pseudarthrobacter sp. NamE2]TLM83564.1 Gfo/Idh/MocA family oxidoreductase [Pseudarthrobacter sp. NamE2]
MDRASFDPDRTLRWAVAGAGTISRSIVPDLQAIPGNQVEVVFSRDPANAARFAKEFNLARWTDDFASVVQDPLVDVLYLATPFATHAAMAREALLAGKHVVIEKPMAMNADEVEELFTLAGSQSLFLMEAMWMKFNPAFQHLFELLDSGVIGKPSSLRAGFGFPLIPDGGSRWDPARSGGTLLDQGIYPVTLAHAIFGEPTDVHARGCLRDDGLDFAEHFTLDFEEGRFAQCASSMTEFVDPTASISGTLGWITIPGMFWTSTTLLMHAGSWAKMFAPEPIEHDREGNGYVPMLRAAGEAIRSGATQHPIHPASDTIAVFRTLDAISKQVKESAARFPFDASQGSRPTESRDDACLPR